MNQSEVRQTFDYDAETGDLIRKSNNKRTGTIDYTGYKRTKYKNKTTLCHRLIYVWHHGDIPDHFHIDHIDHNRANNRIENLQAITPYENYIKKNRKGKKTIPKHIIDWLDYLQEKKTILSYKTKGDQVYIVPFIPVDHIRITVNISSSDRPVVKP